jgi:hypothetical protein
MVRAIAQADPSSPLIPRGSFFSADAPSPGFLNPYSGMAV